MQYQSVSPLRSPNKQKPKISFRCTPSPLKQRPILNINKNISFNTKNGHQQYEKMTVNNGVNSDMGKQNVSFRFEDKNEQESIKFRSNSFVTISSKNDFSFTPTKLSSQKFKCQKCSKRKQSYLIIDLNMKYCSNCALQQMKKGKQVRNINDIQNQRSISPDCSKVKKKCIDIKSSRENLNEQLLKRIQSNQFQLRNKIDHILIENQIKQDFNNKRQQLKRHYEKLKQIIQIAIKKDLDNLKREEQLETLQLKHKKETCLKDLKSLQQIKNNIKNNFQSNNQKDLSDFLGYETSIKNSFNIEEIEQRIKQQFSQRKQIQLSKKEYLYSPEVFMMGSQNWGQKLSLGSGSFPSQTLFSFQKI